MTRTKAREMVASILRDGTNRTQRATQFARDVRGAIESVGNSKALERPLHQHFPTACAPLLPATPTLRALGSLLQPQAQSDSDTGRPRSRSYTKSDRLVGLGAGCGGRTHGKPTVGLACQTSAAKRREGSGTPLSSCAPRSRNVMPEPATRSLTVLETKTASGPARAPTRAAMWTARPARSSPRTSHSPVCRPDRTSIPRVLVALVMAWAQ